MSRKRYPYYWPPVRGFHRSYWCAALVLSLLSARIICGMDSEVTIGLKAMEAHVTSRKWGHICALIHIAHPCMELTMQSWFLDWRCRGGRGWDSLNIPSFSNELSCYLISLTNKYSLWPSDAIWRQGSWSTLAQVMACCLTAPNHYLNQCWLVIS